MLGKDYMLAIVLVNCDDNLWSDQSLETDPDLPPGWRKICDSLGTYYWHVSTGTTQWQHPAHTTCPGGHLEADGEETLQGMDCQAPAAKHLAKNRPIPSPMASLSQRTSLPWQGDDFQHSAEPGSKCFAVRLLGSVEIPEEDLAPGKSSIAVNNCIQQLSNSKGQGSVENQGEGQDLVMILKKDTMSLVDPLDHSLIHRQPILNIRVWGVGCNNGRDRDFAFVASDKDTCVLKCHVFHCNVPAKGIAKALHEMCSKIVAERAVASSRLPCATTLEPVSTEDLPLQVDILEAVRQSMQTYKALYIGSLPVPRAMGMDVLNKAIEKLTRGPGREHWMPSLIHVSDTAMRVHPAQEDEEAAHIWECQVRYVTFLGVGRDAHTFALIVDTGRCFQCTAFWCEPDAGTISEAVQAACMVSGSGNPPSSPALWDTCGRRRRQGLGTEEGKAEGLSGMPNPGGRQGREGADPSELHPTPRHTQPPSDATLRPRLVVCGPAVVSPCSSTPRHALCLASPQVQYQKCLVAAAPAKVKGATGRGWAGPTTATGDAATGAAKASGSSGGAAGPGARRRGLFSLLEAFRLRRALLHSP
ncbi:amyloid-beta A4 precursor protein-binding family B member 3 isoform X2 [Falco naumanni]|uniref:amyloid-beta A4 precursor protein-binding family B member 3 isoform X2 n=1 Tax=Falco naumanni TaxID=148594 RepID=UPI001ADE021D|nr:amyloid-beta A4 precursor protein-binding family B member 3 isoform X2 [Falco naumanni]